MSPDRFPPNRRDRLGEGQPVSSIRFGFRMGRLGVEFPTAAARDQADITWLKDADDTWERYERDTDA